MRSTAGPINALIALYGVARRYGLMDAPWFERIFLASYFAYKKYLEDSFDALVTACPRLLAGGHVLDIGANIGYTVSVFARALTPPFKVIAFEPEPENVRTLKRVVAERGLGGRVECVQAAVGASDGTVLLWRNGESLADHRVVTDEFRRVMKDDSHAVLVPMVSVDNYVSTHHRNEPISFIKIDVQGYELKVFEGMAQTMSRWPDVTIAFEFDARGSVELGFKPSTLLEFVRSHGFRLFDFSRGRLRSLAEDFADHLQPTAYMDVIASRVDLLRRNS
jgi:FkbM family methyltransferase